jgi:hypothetical protein
MMKRTYTKAGIGRRLSVALLAASSFVVIGCTAREDIESGDRFTYEAFDASGAAVVRGTLTFTTLEAGAVEGEWQLVAVGGTGDLGPQIGEGRFAGDLEAGELTLDLNPGIADNNVFLNGVVEGSRITGRWSYSTLLGEINGGRFEADRD